jgi:predicted Zn-dependent protease
MVRLSQYPEYLAAIPAAASGDFASARSSLEALLAKIGAQAEPESLAYVLQLLAGVEAQAGNTEKALSLHEHALSVDSTNPLTLLNCAKSLLGHLNQPALALARLQSAESLLASGAWRPDEHDMPRQWYEREIQSVRAKALRA